MEGEVRIGLHNGWGRDLFSELVGLLHDVDINVVFCDSLRYGENSYLSDCASAFGDCEVIMIAELTTLKKRVVVAATSTETAQGLTCQIILEEGVPALLLVFFPNVDTSVLLMLLAEWMGDNDELDNQIARILWRVRWRMFSPGALDEGVEVEDEWGVHESSHSAGVAGDIARDRWPEVDAFNSEREWLMLADHMHTLFARAWDGVGRAGGWERPQPDFRPTWQKYPDDYFDSDGWAVAPLLFVRWKMSAAPEASFPGSGRGSRGLVVSVVRDLAINYEFQREFEPMGFWPELTLRVTCPADPEVQETLMEMLSCWLQPGQSYISQWETIDEVCRRWNSEK